MTFVWRLKPGNTHWSVSVSLVGQTDEVAGEQCKCHFICQRMLSNRASNCGCTDATACNYDADASIDDGSCIFQEPCSCQLTGNQSASLTVETKRASR